MGTFDFLGPMGGTAGLAIGNEEERKAAEAALMGEEGAEQGLAQANTQAPSTVQQDPAVRAAALKAIAEEQGVAEQGGMDLQSRVAEQEALDKAAQNSGAQRSAALADMARRGTVGGGTTLAGELAGGTQGTNAAAAGSAAAAAAARQRALAAISAGGGLAATQEEADTASQRARDVANQFNAGQRLRQAGDVAQQANVVGGQQMTQGARELSQDTGLGLGIGNTLAEAGNTFSSLGAGGGGGAAGAAESIQAPSEMASGGEVGIVASPGEEVIPPTVAHDPSQDYNHLREYIRKNGKRRP